MSRQAGTADALQAVTPGNDLPVVERISCPVLLTVFFEPVMSVPCGHLIEEDAKNKLETPGKCPCCRESVLTWVKCPPAYKDMLQEEFRRALSQELVSYGDMHFNLDHFAKFVGQKRTVDDKGKVTQEEGLKTPTGLRFITLLQNAANHLNDKAIEGTQKGKSAIEILASTETGRGLMRKYFNIKVVEGKEKYCFGEAEISADSMQIQVKGKSIREWLDPTTELALQEEVARARMTVDAISTLISIRSKARLFSQPSADTETNYNSCDAMNYNILQKVVDGQRAEVRKMLNELKQDDPALLKTVLSSVATRPIIDYSGRTIKNMTLLQAAAAAGDVSLHPELIASNIHHQGMCEIIESYFDVDDQEEKIAQYAKLFPNGIDAFAQEQKDNTFKLQYIFDDISNASLQELDAALSLNGARFDEQDDATRRKSFDQLSLVEKLNRFREAFTQRSLNETVYNPYHLLHAFELYNAFGGRCEQDGSYRNFKERRIFWEQIIGFIQRFMSAADAQAFSQGLWYLIKVDQDSSWRPEVLKNDFVLRCDRSDHFFARRIFPTRATCSGLGFKEACGAGRPWYDEPVLPLFTKLISSKNIQLGKLMQPTKSHQFLTLPSCLVM